MQRHIAIILIMSLVCAACQQKPNMADWEHYQPPDWRKYQANSVSPDVGAKASTVVRPDVTGRVTYHDLKIESDRSLAERLLGAVGRRVTYLDRHKELWSNYQTDNDAASVIDLYTHPDALGSQFGLCGVEKYTVNFDDGGYISTVSMATRYGVEGPIFQKADFDWDYYYNIMCSSAPASHAISYFPAPSSFVAQDVAMILVPAIDLAASNAPLPYRIKCADKADRPCGPAIKNYLASLRLQDIDELSFAGCPLPGGPKEVCFTITTGEGKLGPYPKRITVHGSNYMNNVRVDLVAVEESFTMS